nr:MAG TPA: Radical SAM superfamily [Caudoviricetes sp.]
MYINLKLNLISKGLRVSPNKIVLQLRILQMNITSLKSVFARRNCSYKCVSCKLQKIIQTIKY